MEKNFNFLLNGAATDIGQVRKANEDSMEAFETANLKVFVVCDGMGGHVGGQVASQTAITAIRDFLNNNISIDPCEAIYNSIIEANRAVLNRSRQQPELAGMGSTCVMLVVTSDGKAYYGHVGDSRVYIIANHRIKQLTDDHSEVWEMFQAGIIKTREDMERHPRKNVITNALGLPEMKPPTVCNLPIEPESGNCFLLCSDGLTGMVGDEYMQRIVSKHDIPIQQRAEKLVEMANANGGVDNITVILVEFAIGTQQLKTGKGKKMSWKKNFLYILPVVLLLAGGGGLAWWRLHEKLSCNSENQIQQTEAEADTTTVKTDSTSAKNDNKKNVISGLPQEGQKANIEKPNVTQPPKKIEITWQKEIFVVCRDDTCATVQLSEHNNLKNVLWNTGEMRTSISNPIKANMIKSGELCITWVFGDLPKEKVVIYCTSQEGTVYEISFILHQKEKKEEKIIPPEHFTSL